ncbi:MAG: hypothetical protein K6A31_07925 [Fibrobacter sp.]|nr:hypothetical protein [Fibrobacter sp.]
MNLKLLAGVSVLAFASAFAQDGYYAENPAQEAAPVAEAPAEEPAASPYETEPVAQAPVAAPAPAAEAPAAQTSGSLLAKLDVLRGNSYNFVGSELAATTVGDQLDYPYMMALGQFLYVEPTNALGYVAFNKGLTFYGGLDNSSSNVGLFTAGIATAGFGLGFDIGLSKSFVSEGDDDATVVNAGDDFGVTFAMPLGAYALSLEADWLTVMDETTTDNFEADYWDLSLIARFSNSPSATTLGWTAGALLLRHSITEELTFAGNSSTASDAESRVEIDPYFNLAVQVLGNDMARVMIGSNNTLGIQIYDGGDTGIKSHTEFGLQLEPNIWADFALNENFLFFGGVSHNVLLFGYESVKYVDGGKLSAIQLHTEVTRAQLGLRAQYKMLAVEASLTDEVYTKTVAAIFNGDNIVADLGIFLNF